MNSNRPDPRHRNEVMNWSSIDAYKTDYSKAFKTALDAVKSDEIEKICNAILLATDNERQVLAIGNGGSAAIAEHLCCDWTKGTDCNGHSVISSRSLSSNSAIYSAIANDYGFEHVFETQLDFFARPGDVLIAISSSGNSLNILNAVGRAKTMGVFVAGFCGFHGGLLAKAADACVYVPANNYGIVEDVHQAVMHIIAQYIACRRDLSNKRS